MKITDVEAFHLSIPPSKTGPQVPFVWGSAGQVIVRVRTDDGLTGYGEAFGYGVPAAVAAVVNQTLKPLLLGADAAAISAASLWVDNRPGYERSHWAWRAACSASSRSIATGVPATPRRLPAFIRFSGTPSPGGSGESASRKSQASSSQTSRQRSSPPGKVGMYLQNGLLKGVGEVLFL
ncbi:MAG: hypothetical protein IIA40_06680 [SAR324 cluster bacterium]|nr:hypothetical protein [SAR324 cluster bacterium]